MLGALILTAYHDSRGEVGDTNRGIRGVDVLSTGSGGAERINTQILLVNLNCQFLIQFRHDMHGGKGSMTAFVESNGEIRTRRWIPLSA